MGVKLRSTSRASNFFALRRKLGTGGGALAPSVRPKIEKPCYGECGRACHFFPSTGVCGITPQKFWNFKYPHDAFWGIFAWWMGREDWVILMHRNTSKMLEGGVPCHVLQNYWMTSPSFRACCLITWTFKNWQLELEPLGLHHNRHSPLVRTLFYRAYSS